MPTDATPAVLPATETAANRPGEDRSLSPASERALAEAAARRAARERDPPDRPKESGGRGGLEPTRYGDWEVGGMTSDF